MCRHRLVLSVHLSLSPLRSFSLEDARTDSVTPGYVAALWMPLAFYKNVKGRESVILGSGRPPPKAQLRIVASAVSIQQSSCLICEIRRPLGECEVSKPQTSLCLRRGSGRGEGGAGPPTGGWSTPAAPNPCDIYNTSALLGVAF
jgi:hypothetical protein